MLFLICLFLRFASSANQFLLEFIHFINSCFFGHLEFFKASLRDILTEKRFFRLMKAFFYRIDIRRRGLRTLSELLIFYQASISLLDVRGYLIHMFGEGGHNGIEYRGIESGSDMKWLLSQRLDNRFAGVGKDLSIRLQYFL